MGEIKASPSTGLVAGDLHRQRPAEGISYQEDWTVTGGSQVYPVLA